MEINGLLIQMVMVFVMTADTDDDGDGVLDTADAFPLDPMYSC